MKYGLEYAGSRRVRRGWGACVVRAGLLVVLVAFLIWLVGSVLGVIAETLEVSSFRFQVSSGLPLAMAATGGGVSPWVATVVAWGVLSLCLVGIGVHAWRRVMEWHAVGEFVDELQRASNFDERSEGSLVCEDMANNQGEVAETDPFAARVQDGAMKTGKVALTSPDVRRIVEACQQECLDARTLVESARQTLSMDDYEDALVGASRRLKQVMSCLANLADDEFWETLARDERAEATEPAEAGTTNREGRAVR